MQPLSNPSLSLLISTDQSLGYLGGQEPYFCHTVGAAWPDAPNASHARNNNKSGASNKCVGPEFPVSKTSKQKSCQMYDFWEDNHPGNTTKGYDSEYSLYIYTRRVEKIISTHNQAFPLFIYFASQNIHDPHEVGRLCCGGWCSCHSAIITHASHPAGARSLHKFVQHQRLSVRQSMWPQLR